MLRDACLKLRHFSFKQPSNQHERENNAVGRLCSMMAKDTGVSLAC